MTTKDSPHKPHTVPKYIIYGFFTLGLVSAIAFRVIIVFQHVEPAWVRPVWYIAVIGYFLFFLYRFKISQKRKKAINDYQLIEKVKANACLTDEDREVVTYLLSSIKVSLEDINYAIIFITSILAILADLILSSLY
ncbi:MAG: hypothetical protein JSV21_07370 [Nitrospirota bacterium]|nr:MAG: hypothetical protein JSV21_07370 [Nitrospirota bacterium]